MSVSGFSQPAKPVGFVKAALAGACGVQPAASQRGQDQGFGEQQRLLAHLSGAEFLVANPGFSRLFAFPKIPVGQNQAFQQAQRQCPLPHRFAADADFQQFPQLAPLPGFTGPKLLSNPTISGVPKNITPACFPGFGEMEAKYKGKPGFQKYTPRVFRILETSGSDILWNSTDRMLAQHYSLTILCL